MPDLTFYQKRREALKKSYLPGGDAALRPVKTAGVDHLALIFFDIGGGNQLAFFDFPEKGPARTVRGVGSMHHIALKTRPEQMRAIIGQLDERHIPYSMHGTSDAGSIYVRDPDEILVELTTG